MLWTVVKKELWINLTSLRFSVSVFILVVLVIASLVVSSKEYTEQLRDYENKVKLHKAFAKHNNITLDRRPPKLSLLFRGVVGNVGSSVELTVGETPELKESSDENLLSPLFPPVDLGFVLGMVMSLMAFFLTYDAILGERERGTLKLILSNQVPRSTVLLGKWIGGYLTLLVALIIATSVGLTVLELNIRPGFARDDWIALGTIGLTVLIYLATFCSLGIMVSATTRSSATAILALLLIWVLSVLVVPSLSPRIAAAIIEAPSPQKIAAEKRVAKSERFERAKKRHAVASARAEAEHWTDERIANAAWWIDASEAKRYKDEMMKLERELDNAVRRQVRLSHILSYISPYGCFSTAVPRLAGTGIESHWRFLEAARRFDSAYFEAFYRFTENRAKDISEVKLSLGKWWWPKPERVPQFRFEEEGITERVAGVLSEIVVLVVYAVLFFMISYLRFLRYDVR